MAWSDSPTESQIGALLREYEAYLLDELDYAERTGARTKEIALQDLINEGLLRSELMILARGYTRRDFSVLIAKSEKEHFMEPSVQRVIDKWLMTNYGVEIDYERVRQGWAKEREQCRMN